MIIEYGTFKIDTAALPTESLDALLRRGVSHYLGNEVASKVTAWIKGQVVEELGDDTKSADVTKAQIEDFRLANPEKVKEAIGRIGQESFDSMAAGTMGQGGGGGGAKLDPLTRAMRDIAEEQVFAACKAAKIARPSGAALTALVGEVIRANEEAITAEAKKRLKATAGLVIAVDLSGLKTK